MNAWLPLLRSPLMPLVWVLLYMAASQIYMAKAAKYLFTGQWDL